MNRLAGKTVLVVGGGAAGERRPDGRPAMGNGRATAIACAREGAQVMVADISLESADTTVALITEEGHVADSCQCDATDPARCEAAVAATVARFGGLQLLVNVLGIVDRQTIDDVDLDTFDRCFHVNLRSNLLMMKYAIPELTRAGGGAIVNVSSIAAVRSGAGIAYEATKAAQVALSRSVAISVATRNIRVNTVLPGTIDTPILQRSATPELAAHMTARIPMGRPGTPWEVASVICFLLSDAAAFVTGTELLIDGGARGAPA
jgi:NAD(P)-dependent dehydrogenase (short-subunit alcohol dehydrogenase family)